MKASQEMMTSVPGIKQPHARAAFPLHDMITISIDCLEGMRQQCASVAHLTKQQVRALESKLVRMFAAMLVLSARKQREMQSQQHPVVTSIDIREWLRVVGMSQSSRGICLRHLATLEDLLQKTDEQLKDILHESNPEFYSEDYRRLSTATKYLRKCKDAIMAENKPINIVEIAETEEPVADLFYWDSWDPTKYLPCDSMGNVSAVASPRHQRTLLSGDGEGVGGYNSRRQSPAHELSKENTHEDLGHYGQNAALALTLTPSPPNSPFTPPTHSNFSSIGNNGGGVGGMIMGGSLNSTPQHAKLNSTPPPMLRHQTLLGSLQSMSLTHVPEMSGKSVLQQDPGTGVPLSKSKSNESPFRGASFSAASSPPQSLISATINSNYAGSSTSIVSRTRLNTDPSPESFSSTNSEIYAPEDNNNMMSNNLQVPRSPCTPIKTGYMSHTIAHRFSKVFKMMSTCDLCQKQMFFGLKCKECKYRCHKDCEMSVPPSCGLPRAFVDAFKMTLKDDTNIADGNSTASPNANTLGKKIIGCNRSASSAVQSAHLDSTSPGSSCHSSSPSSPALFGLQHKRTGSHSGSVSYAVGSTNIMNSSGGGSSSTSSNMLSTPSSYHSKNVSQFNFPDVTVTSNCNQLMSHNTHTILSAQASAAASATASLSAAASTGVGPGSGSASAADTLTSEYSMTVSSINGHTITGMTDYQDSISSFSSFKTAIESETSRSLTSTLTSTLNYDAYPPSYGGSQYPRKFSTVFPEKPTPLSEFSDTHKSNDSDKTISLSGSASTDSDRTPVRVDSTEDGDSGQWPRQNSLSMKEWDIPYSDIMVMEKIGKGRFGTVHRALWHGDVAVKLLKEDYLRDEHMLETFKDEVANFKKTRHENLVLFMGACMNPPYLAIVTSLCKGITLYTFLHLRHEKLNVTRSTMVAQQISHGMSYLHARGILHKDLRTKNIFLENGKVVITDFGLVGSTKLLYCDIGLGVPTKGWLCYLAPEIMRALLPTKPTEEVLPFTVASDVYAFGTVWYELLCGEFPFKGQPSEAVIWQVGRGMKQTLANLHTSRDIKDILMVCWAFQPDDRPDFQGVIKLMDKLPRKRLARSPSHPIQISRSAESVF